jgi:hypothetical protein
VSLCRRYLQFIAPEAIISKRSIEPIVDVFSWAAAAFHLIRGDNSRTISNSLAEDDENNPPEFYSAVHEHSTRTPPDLSTLRLSIPPELGAIVRKARSLDPEDRYQTVSALLHDLNRIKDICSGRLRGKERDNFCVGHVDDRSRFNIPPGMLDRKEEYAELDRVFELVKNTGTSQVACCWGESGCGKSKLLETWVRAKESNTGGGRDFIVGWAQVRAIPYKSHGDAADYSMCQMDSGHIKPYSAFIAVFCSLLERIFSDPLESASTWRRRILRSLPVNANVFLALLPEQWRVTLLGKQDSDELDHNITAGIDWESWVTQFRTWSYGLLRLFASERRPLVKTQRPCLIQGNCSRLPHADRHHR